MVRRSPNFLNECSVTGPDGTTDRHLPSRAGARACNSKSSYPYFIPRVCNVWTVQAIECLGGEINPWLALTADGLVRQAEKPPQRF